MLLVSQTGAWGQSGVVAETNEPKKDRQEVLARPKDRISGQWTLLVKLVRCHVAVIESRRFTRFCADNGGRVEHSYADQTPMNEPGALDLMSEMTSNVELKT